MKKTFIPIACIVFALLLLLPIPHQMKDGGTVEYRAVLYSVSDVHRLDSSSITGYKDGKVGS